MSGLERAAITTAVILGGFVLATTGGSVVSTVTAQTCTPPPANNITIQVGGANNQYGANGRSLRGEVSQSFSATIQTLGISSPVDITITGFPPGIEHRSTPLHPLGGNTFAGTPTQPGTYTLQITLQNDCGSETYTVPFVVDTFTPGPTCTITNTSGQIQRGETATLSWTVSGNPTGATFSPALPGSPNGTVSGSVETGPINSNTTFRLSVSNSNGTTGCEVVVSVSGSAGELVHKATLIDLPNRGWFSHGGNQNIQDVAYFGDNFAFSGECGGGRNEQHGRLLETQGGAWFFKDSGTFVAERNACIDGGADYLPLFFHGHAYSALAADGDQGVVMRIRSHGPSCQNCNTNNPQVGSGAYKPVYYQVNGSSVSASPAPWGPEGRVEHSYNGGIAVANSILVAQNSINPTNTSLLQLPSFQSLSSASPMKVITGFEGYVIGQTDSQVSGQGTGCPQAGVYRPTSNGQLQFLHNITTAAGLCLGGHGIDYTTSPKRIGFLTYSRTGGTSQASDRLFMFAPGANGLELVEERQLPRTDLQLVFGTTQKDKIGIAGDYLALPFAGSPARFEVWNGTERVGEAELPFSRPYGASAGEEPGPIQKLIITKNGDVMVSAYYGAHLYELTTLTPPSPPGGPGIPTQSEVDPAMFLDLARQYLETLLPFFNSPRRTP